jgi:hypothetical protein
VKKRLPAHPDMGIDHRIDSLSLPFLAIGHVRMLVELGAKTLVQYLARLAKLSNPG